MTRCIRPLWRAVARAATVAQASDSVPTHDAVAGLARVALAQGDVAAALGHVESLLAHLHQRQGATLEGGEAPHLIRLTCYQVLLRAGDPRAGAALQNAHDELQSRAATITDAPLRQSFLNDVPEHREIAAAWGLAARPAPGPTTASG